MILLNFSEDLGILKFVQSCGRHLALLLETTYSVRMYYVNCSEASKICPKNIEYHCCKLPTSKETDSLGGGGSTSL